MNNNHNPGMTSSPNNIRRRQNKITTLRRSAADNVQPNTYDYL